MFATLLESRRTVRWPIGNGALSLLAHTAVVSFAIVFTTARPDTEDGAPSGPAPVERIQYAAVTPRDEGARDGRAGRPRVARRIRRVAAPTEVPFTLPEPIPVELGEHLEMLLASDVAAVDADLERLVVRTDEFERIGDAGREKRRQAALAALAAHPAGTPWHATDVERMAVPFDDNPRPRYPFSLLSMGMEGNVVVQFVVDSTGAPDMRSLRVLRSTHQLFTRAVRAVLPKLRFLPAEVAGARVDVLVEQPFQFSVR
jgi:TonB family protein